MGIIETNKLIAEFMGLVVSDRENYTSELHTNVDADLKYHTSWDWLMPVVEKITNLEEFTSPKEPKDWAEKKPYRVYTGHIDSVLYTDLACALIRHTNKELVYEAVVEFINNQNQ